MSTLRQAYGSVPFPEWDQKLDDYDYERLFNHPFFDSLSGLQPTKTLLNGNNKNIYGGKCYSIAGWIEGSGVVMGTNQKALLSCWFLPTSDMFCSQDRGPPQNIIFDFVSECGIDPQSNQMQSSTASAFFFYLHHQKWCVLRLQVETVKTRLSRILILVQIPVLLNFVIDNYAILNALTETPHILWYL